MATPSTIIQPKKELNGSIAPPGDKSISHRALILSAMTEGTSTISGLSNGNDVAGTQVIMDQLGARFKVLAPSRVEVQGAGASIHPASASLDCAMRPIWFITQQIGSAPRRGRRLLRNSLRFACFGTEAARCFLEYDFKAKSAMVRWRPNEKGGDGK